MKIAVAALALLTCLTSAAFAAEPSFKTAMTSTERLTKGQKGGYFYKGGTLYDHIWEGMSVPDDNYRPTALADGNYIFFGWRRHSAFEKSAIVTSPLGEMLAAALIHYPGSDPYAPVVTIFLRRSHKDETLAKHLRDWAWRAEPKANTFDTRFLDN